MQDYLSRMGKSVLIVVITVSALNILHTYLNNEREDSATGQTPEIRAEIPLNPAQGKLWRITAYCPCVKCCGKWSDGITASGKPAQGKLIAAPSEIPFGTWIDIPGYGMAEVLDRGGSIKGRRLDILFTDDENNTCTGHQKALNWGVKYLRIGE